MRYRSSSNNFIFYVLYILIRNMYIFNLKSLTLILMITFMSHLKNIEIFKNLFLTFHIEMCYSLFLGKFKIEMEGNVFIHSRRNANIIFMAIKSNTTQ